MSRLGIVMALGALAFGGCSDSDKAAMKYTVQSRSMEPTIRVGQNVMVVPYSSKPKEGDIVLIKHPDYAEPVIHRLALIDGAMIQTKGDANKLYDRPLPASAIIGQAFPL